MTHVPWFRYGHRETRRWLRRCVQRARKEKIWPRYYDAALAREAYHRCVRLRESHLRSEER